MIFESGSAFRPAGNGPGPLGVKLLIDTTPVGVCALPGCDEAVALTDANEVASHAGIAPAVPAGQPTLTLAHYDANSATDTTDVF